MKKMTEHLIGVHHDGAGKYPRQTLYTDDPGALVRAQAVDPGHAHGIYEYEVPGIANRFREKSAAAAMAARYGIEEEKQDG